MRSAASLLISGQQNTRAMTRLSAASRRGAGKLPDKLEARHVLAKHDEAHGQRSRHQQTERDQSQVQNAT